VDLARAHCPLLDAQHSQQQLVLQDLLQQVLESQGLICSLTETGEHALGEDAGVERSPLQIELILRSLNPSLAKRLGRVLP